MKCKKYRKNLIDFLENNLKQDIKENIEAHINSCEACRREIENIKDVLPRLQHMGQEYRTQRKEPAGNLHINIISHIQDLQTSFGKERKPSIAESLQKGLSFFIGKYAGMNRQITNKTGWWGISLMLHAVCILIAAFFLVFPSAQSRYETTVSLSQGKIKNYGYIRKKHNINNTYTGLASPGPLEEDAGLEFSKELPSEDFLIPQELDMAHTTEGMNPAVSEMNMNREHWIFPIDDFGEGFALFNIRTGNKRKKALIRFGGSHVTEAAVLGALNWFKRHQAKDGSWSFEDYHNECKLNPPCEHVPEILTKGYVSTYKKHRDLDNAATGFALLCFLGAGHTHIAGRFRQQVTNGLSNLMKAQKDDGAFCVDNYVHAITTMAITEAYGMTRSAQLKEQVQKAVNLILDRKHEYLAWNYDAKGAVGGYLGRSPSRNDTSITGWNVMALKSAKSSGIDIGNGFEGAKKFLEKVTPGIKGGAYKPILKEHVAYTYWKGKDNPEHRNATLTAIGMLCRVFIGEDTQGKALRAHANMVLKEIPKTFEDANMYQIYYATLAMFQMGGHYWNEWNTAMKKILCDNQCKGGCEDGSWYVKNPVWYNHMGRLFHTAMGCLTLEVYYRYMPVFLHNELGDTK